MEITIWSDFSCPQCYIAKANLERAIKESDLANVTIQYRAFELNPDIPPNAVEPAIRHIAEKYKTNIAQAQTRIAEITEMARNAGLAFRFASSKYCNTLNAHRLVKFAYATAPEKVETLVDLLFAGFFNGCVVLSDPKVLEDIAIEAGFEAENTTPVIESDDYLEEVRKDEEYAKSQGISEIPCVIIDGEATAAGSYSVADFRNVLGHGK